MDYTIIKQINDLSYFTTEAKKVSAQLTGVTKSQENVILHFSSEQDQSVIDAISAIQEPAGNDMAKIVRDRLRFYRTKSVDLVDQIMVENTLSGMTDAQSAHLFQKINAAIDAIQLGALPTAKRLLQEEMTDFIFTSSKKARYIQLVEEAMQL